MNLLCDVSIFNIHSVFFLDPKKNMVIDGKFTKMVYSDSIVSLNGLYLYCPIESAPTKIPSSASRGGPGGYHQARHRVEALFDDDGSDQDTVSDPRGRGGGPRGGPESDPDTSMIVTKKVPFMFSLLNPTNIYLIKELNRIEHEIIEHYKEYFQINKMNVYSLRNQLKSGNIKVVHKVPQGDEGGGGEDAVRGGSRAGDPRPIVVKISGIWETDINVGITFKFQK